MHSRHFWIIKHVDLKPIIFAINLDAVCIDCIAHLNQ